MLPSWEARPIAIAHLLNPAFCGEILRRCSYHYKISHPTNDALPFQLAFIILPLVLHKNIREVLPKMKSKNFISWLEENQSIKMLIPNLTRSTTPYTKEAIMFLLMYRIIEINQLGGIEVITNSPKLKSDENEVSECFKKSELVGRWLATSGNSQSIFISLGIKP